MVMSMRWSRRDEGYSIAELMMTLAIMGVVVSAAYALLHLAGVSAQQSDRQAWMASEIGKPLDAFERSFMQQAPLMPAAEGQTCTIRTDQDRDNHYEYHRYTATADGLLTETFWEDVDSPTGRDRVWSRANANVVAGVPLFTYYDQYGEDITLQEDGVTHEYNLPEIQVYADSIVITIVTTHEGQQYSDSRRVYFRNQR